MVTTLTLLVTIVLGALVLFGYASFLPRKVRALLLIVTTGPFYLFCQYMDEHYRHWFNLWLPRNLAEIQARPYSLHKIIQPYLPQGARIVGGVQVAAMHTDEPKKNETSAMINVTYTTSNNTQAVMPLFVKFTGERKWPMAIKVLQAAVSPAHVEVEFHRQLASKVLVPSPVFRGAAFSRTFQRSIICTELLPRDMYRTQPDHEHCDYLQCVEMLTSMSRMHAQYWGDRALCAPETEFVREVRGCCGLEIFDRPIQLFMPKVQDQWFVKLWSKLCDYFANERVCLLHGDFRPGNMLFLPRTCACRRAGSDRPCREVFEHGEWVDSNNNNNNNQAKCQVMSGREADHERPPRCVFADWEALGILPFMWDFTYFTTLAHSPEMRRQRHDRLLTVYLDALRANGVPAEDLDRERAELHWHLMILVLVYYSWMLVQFDAVGDVQGNSGADMVHWTNVIKNACADVDVDRVVSALDCDPQAVRLLCSKSGDKAEKL